MAIFQSGEKLPQSKYAGSAIDDSYEGHGWAESRNFFPDDQRLRKEGWKIHSRPKDGEAMWIKGGRIVEFSKALMELPPVKEHGCRPKSGSSRY